MFVLISASITYSFVRTMNWIFYRIYNQANSTLEIVRETLWCVLFIQSYIKENAIDPY